MFDRASATLQPHSTDAELERARAYALTIVAHPDVSRVGDVAWLMDAHEGEQIELNRLTPCFRSPSGRSEGPLGVGWVSRSGLRIEATRGKLELTLDASQTTMEVVLEGAPLAGRAKLDQAALARGVTLELARHVALLIHLRVPAFFRDGDLGLVGASEALDALRRDIVRVADLEVPVLLRGESGVGKELVASALHRQSKRSAGPYVCVNMAALPPSVAASELFGHARGAFTGAQATHDGYFVRADSGTLFMDEIADLPSELQPLLLRALENHEVQAVGASKLRKVDVRLIAATDADLERAAAEGRFRLPLLQRLSGYELRVPPLRERRDDVGRLFMAFLRQELAATCELDRLKPPAADQKPWLSARFVAQLVRHAWPGNVRQLRNVARQLAISNRGEQHLRIDSALERLLAAPGPLPSQPPIDTRTMSRPATSDPGARRPAELTDAEVAAAWRAGGYRLERAAQILGCSRSWLHTRLEGCTGVRRATDLRADEIRTALRAHGDDLERAAESLEVSARALQLQLKRVGRG